MSRSAIISLLLLLALPAWAAEDPGTVLFVSGDVTAERGSLPVALMKFDPVYEQDIIVTAARSRGQLLMRDGAKYALRPETRFAVLEYFVAGDERTQADGSVVVASQGGAVTELIKGGFRTITGAIGKKEPDEYKLETLAATMGIRGTQFSVRWCAGDCRIPPGVTRTKPIVDGLYVRISDGTVVFVNNTGEFVFEANDYIYVRDYNTRPVRLTEKPAALIDTFPHPPRSVPYFPFEPPIGLVSVARGPISGESAAFSASSRQIRPVIDRNDLITFETAPGTSFETARGTYALGTSDIRNDGFDSITGFGWGRWSDGVATLTTTGAPVDVDLTMQSLHWVYGPKLNARPAVAIMGSASFTVIVGNTDPTDTLGHSGALGDATLYADFSAATVESNLSLFINNNLWQANGSGSITDEFFSGDYNVLISGQDGSSGTFSGFFGAATFNTFPSAVGLTYGLTDTQGPLGSVSGAVVLGQAPAP